MNTNILSVLFYWISSYVLTPRTLSENILSTSPGSELFIALCSLKKFRSMNFKTRSHKQHVSVFTVLRLLSPGSNSAVRVCGAQ